MYELFVVLLSQSVIYWLNFTGSKYKIWYHHTSEPDINYIPYNIIDIDLTSYTPDELSAATQGLEITHMYIKGNIPPNLDKIAANLREIKLSDTTNSDQLQKWVMVSLWRVETTLLFDMPVFL